MSDRCNICMLNDNFMLLAIYARVIVRVARRATGRRGGGGRRNRLHHVHLYNCLIRDNRNL
jgi:hypothetical protein